MVILNLSESLAKPLVMAKLNMAYLSSLKNRAKLLLSSLPVSPSRVLRAPGTSSYHLVPEHLQATWPRPEQSHLLPEACSPNGTDNRQQRQRRTKRPPPEPSNILKRCYALYDDEIHYYMKKVSKLYCLFNRNSAGVPIWEHGKKRFAKKIAGVKRLNVMVCPIHLKYYDILLFNFYCFLFVMFGHYNS